MSPHLRAPAWMVLASALFAGMGLLVKLAAEGASVGEVVFWRNAVSFALLLPFALRDPAMFRATQPWPMVLRSVTGVASMFCYFTAINRLRLGDAVMISYASPLFVGLFSPALLGEPARPGMWRALLVGFLGVALVADPSFAGDVVGVMAAVATAVLAGAAYVFVRLATRTERNDTIVLWFCGLSALAFVPAPLMSGGLDGDILLLLVGVGLVGLVAQLVLTHALATGEATTVSLFGYLTPVFAYMAGMAFLDQSPGWRGLLGTALVTVAGWMAARSAGPEPS